MDKKRDELLKQNNEPEEEIVTEPVKKPGMRRGVLYALIGILAAVFLLSGIYLLGYFMEVGKAEGDYQELDGIYQNGWENIQPTQPSGNEDTPDTDPTQPQPQTVHPVLKPIYERNHDLVGWLEVDGVKISYPVMQSPGREDFYLDRDFYKQTNKSGCPYIPNSCDVFKPSDNLVIYGHYMKTGGMFRNLTSYDEKSYWEKHPTFTFQSLYEEPHTYQIFAVFKTCGTLRTGEGTPWGYPYHRMNDFATEEEFDQFIADIKGAAFTGKNAYQGASFYDTGITPKFGDKLICLSTCEYTVRNPDGDIDGRFVVVGVRID